MPSKEKDKVLRPCGGCGKPIPADGATPFCPDNPECCEKFFALVALATPELKKRIAMKVSIRERMKAKKTKIVVLPDPEVA